MAPIFERQGCLSIRIAWMKLSDEMDQARKMALALMAHPDDAEILCAGTLIRLRKIGWAIHIATLTGGDCGTTTMSAAEIAAPRRREATAAAKAMGADYSCFDEMDAQVVYDRATIRKVVAYF